MQQILVDMDGVLADVYAQFIELEYKDSGIRHSMESLNGKKEWEAFPSGTRHVRTPGFFRTVPLMPGSVEGLKVLNERYKVLIVSAAMEFPLSLSEKQIWLQEHFPFIGWEQLIFCGRKDSIQGDIMLDDHPKNLRGFGGRKLMFAQPHNFTIEEPGFERVASWEEVLRALQG